MRILIRDGRRLCVLRPKNPEAAVKHAQECLKKQKWRDYPGETEFVGYACDPKERVCLFSQATPILNADGEQIDTMRPGDIFATGHDA